MSMRPGEVASTCSQRNPGRAGDYNGNGNKRQFRLRVSEVEHKWCLLGQAIRNYHRYNSIVSALVI